MERNLQKQIEEKDFKASKTEIEALTSMITDAVRDENSVKRELLYNGQKLDYTLANEFAKDI